MGKLAVQVAPDVLSCESGSECGEYGFAAVPALEWLDGSAGAVSGAIGPSLPYHAQDTDNVDGSLAIIG